MATLRDTETTNILLLIILLVVLAGFGFLAPIFWVLAGLVGLWLLLNILGAIASGIGAFVDTVENYLARIFSPVWRMAKAFAGNDTVQWCLLIGAAGISLWLYFTTQKDGYIAALIFLALMALFKLVSRLDNMIINRKYKRHHEKDA